MSAQPELFQTPRFAPPRQKSSNDLTRICATLHGVARVEVEKCRRDPSRANWAKDCARTLMVNYAATARARILAEVLGGKS